MQAVGEQVLISVWNVEIRSMKRHVSPAVPIYQGK